MAKKPQLTLNVTIENPKKCFFLPQITFLPLPKRKNTLFSTAEYFIHKTQARRIVYFYNQVKPRHRSGICNQSQVFGEFLIYAYDIKIALAPEKYSYLRLKNYFVKIF